MDGEFPSSSFIQVNSENINENSWEKLCLQRLMIGQTFSDVEKWNDRGPEPIITHPGLALSY